jgi:predicted PurR-regulated permease PerM
VEQPSIPGWASSGIVSPVGMPSPSMRGVAFFFCVRYWVSCVPQSEPSGDYTVSGGLLALPVDAPGSIMQRTTLQYAFFLMLVLLVTLAFVGLIQEFLLPLFWAATLAIVFSPLYQWWQSRLGNRASLAALLTLGVILVAVILPLFLVSVAVVHEAVAFYKRLETGDINVQEPLQTLEGLLPVVTQYLDRFGIDIQNFKQGLAGATVTVSRFLGTQALSLGQDALRLSVLFCLMLYLLFFFLRDGTQLVAAIIRALPLGHTREHRLLANFAAVSRATIKGTLVVALVQGLLGGILFAIVGINAAVLWGALMAVLSLLPAVGSGLVWVPAAGIFLVTGHIGKGLILLGVGVLVIGLVDNLLRPILIGRDTRMPDYLVLLSTLGGLTVFGISGLLIGPIIAALFLAVWDMFAQEQQDGHPAAETPAAENRRDP